MGSHLYEGFISAVQHKEMILGPPQVTLDVNLLSGPLSGKGVMDIQSPSFTEMRQISVHNGIWAAQEQR